MKYDTLLENWNKFLREQEAVTSTVDTNTPDILKDINKKQTEPTKEKSVEQQKLEDTEVAVNSVRRAIDMAITSGQKRGISKTDIKSKLLPIVQALEEEKKKAGDRCTRIAKRKYKVWPSAYASGAVVKCRQGKIWKGISENATDEEIDFELLLEEVELIEEEWSDKYKRSIDCNNPKGFSQKAHCQGRKKKVNEQSELSSDLDDTYTFDPKSDKFVEKPISKEVKLFVLIGPPAVGKSTWEKKYFAGIPESSILRINRDILIEKMFLSTGFSNKQLFTPVPADVGSDYIHPEFGRIIEYTFNNKLRRAYEKPYKAANSINEKYYKLIMEAVSGYYDYVLLDGIYATPEDRKRAVDLLSATPNLKKIAVYFESKGHEEEIIARSEKRAEKMKAEFPVVKGKHFDRTIDKEQYKGIFEKLTPPTYQEPANFDTIMYVKFGGEGEYQVLEEAKKKRPYKPNFSREKKQGLHGWFARNKGKGWINCRTGGPCGRSDADSGGKYPACRPTKAQCKSAGKGPLRKKKSSKPISWTKKKKKD